MKTKMTLLFLLSFVIFSGSYAQTISNGSFENWSQQLLFEEPVPYTTTNLNLYMFSGSGNITKSTDSHGGSYATRLETVIAGSDTIFGGMFIGTPGPGGINGGIPIVTHADSLSIFAKFDIAVNDTSYILVIFKDSGQITGMGAFVFYGTQSTYTEFKTAVNWFQPDNSDTMAVIITSSNLDYAKIPGSTLFIDDITLLNTAAVFPNGDFETWTNISVEDPDDWFTLNFAGTPGNYSVTQSADSYDGLYAAQIENVITTYGDTMGFITNGRFGSDGPEGGMHELLNPEKVTGYYKYSPVGPDTALAGCFIYGYDSFGNYGLLDSTMLSLEAKSSYTYFEMPIAYNNWPLADTLNISFASGNIENGNSYVGLGSILLIDKLEVTYKPMGVNENLNENNISVFPNPATSDINISIDNADSKSYNIELYNETGQKIYSEVFVNDGTSLNHLNLSMLSEGFYYLKINNGEKIITKKLVIQ